MGATLLLLLAASQARPRPASTVEALKAAEALIAEGRTIEAARALRAHADRAKSAEALLRLARLQAAEGRTSAALESLREALALAPNSEDLLAAYAQLSLTARLPLPAILALDPLTRMCPGVAQYHYQLGVALMQAGDMASAIESLRRADRLEPARPLALVALGMALNNRKNYAEARTELLRALSLDPESAEGLAALAESEAGLGELPRAEGHARRALQRGGATGTASLVLGMVLMRQERFGEAREALEQAVASEPGSSRAHYQLSLACARLGDDAAAQAHVELYRRTLREEEARLVALRRQTGQSEGGMQP